MANITRTSDLPPLPAYHLEPLPRLLAPISDEHLLIILPTAVYWAVGLFFHWISENGYWQQYAIHTPAEFLKRNRVSKADAIKNVLFQQLLHLILGGVFSMKSEEPLHGKEEYDIARWARTIRLAQRMVPGLLSVLGIKSGILAEKMASSYPAVAGVLAGGNYAGLTQTISSATSSKVVAPAFARWELALASFVYHYGVPAFQFAAAVVFNDAWQYFWHRTFHQNKWLFGGLPSRAFGRRINMVT